MVLIDFRGSKVDVSQDQIQRARDIATKGIGKFALRQEDQVTVQLARKFFSQRIQKQLAAVDTARRLGTKDTRIKRDVVLINGKPADQLSGKREKGLVREPPIDTTRTFVSLGTPFPTVDKSASLAQQVDISAAASKKERQRRTKVVKEFIDPKVEVRSVGLKDIFKTDKKIRRRGLEAGGLVKLSPEGDVLSESAGFFAFVGKDGRFEVVRPENRQVGETLTRIASGEPRVSAAIISAIDEGTDRLDKRVVAKLDEKGVPKDSLLRKEIDFSLGEFALFAAFSPLLETAAAGKGLKTKQVTKTKKVKKKADKKKVKDAIKKASDEDTKRFRDIQRDNILKSDLSDKAKQDALVRLDALIFEAKTGKKIILESGAIDLRILNQALNAIKKKKRNVVPPSSKASIEILIKTPPPRLPGTGAVPGVTKASQVKETPKPKIVGGRGVDFVKGEFTGQGAFERTAEQLGIATQLERVGALKKSTVRKQQEGVIPLSLQDQRNIIQFKSSELERSLQDQGLTQWQINLQKNLQKQLMLQGATQTQVQKSLQKQLQLMNQGQKAAQVQKQSLKLLQAQAQAQKQLQKQRTRLGLRTRPPRGRLKPRIPKPFLIPPPFGRGKVKSRKVTPGVKKKSKGYNVQVKRKGIFKKVNKVPLTKTKAKDLGALLTSKTLAATFKISKAKKPAQKPKVRAPKGFFKRNAKQYRPFKRVGGKKVSTPNTFIERRKYRLDSPLEKRNIQRARRKR